jgi:hypothetical protein
VESPVRIDRSNSGVEISSDAVSEQEKPANYHIGYHASRQPLLPGGHQWIRERI